jgi:hypothetical protein
VPLASLSVLPAVGAALLGAALLGAGVSGVALPGCAAGVVPLVFRHGMLLHAASENASRPARSTRCCVSFIINSSIVGLPYVCVTMRRATSVRWSNERDVPVEAGSAERDQLSGSYCMRRSAARGGAS